MSFALLFSGQGTQHPAMLPWLARDDTVSQVEARLGADWRERLADPAWAGCNAHAQLLLTGLGLAAWQQLARQLPAPAVVAGYSVGELAAFAAAGVYGVPAALELAVERAACMDRAARACETGLLGISGIAEPRLAQLCADFGLSMAIRSGPVSVIVGGPRPALAPAADAAHEAGGHGTVLNVGLASHTPWMAPAAAEFAQVLADRPFTSPACVLLSGAAGRVRDPAQARAALARQIDHVFRWDECMEEIAARGVCRVLEVGPGQALARLWNQQYPDIPARSVDEFRSAAGIVHWVK